MSTPTNLPPPPESAESLRHDVQRLLDRLIASPALLGPRLAVARPEAAPPAAPLSPQAGYDMWWPLPARATLPCSSHSTTIPTSLCRFITMSDLPGLSLSVSARQPEFLRSWSAHLDRQ